MYPFEYMNHYQSYYSGMPKPVIHEARTRIIGNGTLPPYMKMAHAYVPYQFWGNTFQPADALQKGTIFPDLYQPYEKQRGWGK